MYKYCNQLSELCVRPVENIMENCNMGRTNEVKVEWSKKSG